MAAFGTAMTVVEAHARQRQMLITGKIKYLVIEKEMRPPLAR